MALLAKLFNKLLPQGDALNIWKKFVLFIAIIQFFTFNIVCAVAHKGGFNGGKIKIFILPAALFVLILVIGITCLQVIKIISRKRPKEQIADVEDGQGISGHNQSAGNTSADIKTGNVDEPAPATLSGWT